MDIRNAGSREALPGGAGREPAITAMHWEVGLAMAAVPLTALLAYEFLGLILSLAFPHTHG